MGSPTVSAWPSSVDVEPGTSPDFRHVSHARGQCEEFTAVIINTPTCLDPAGMAKK